VAGNVLAHLIFLIILVLPVQAMKGIKALDKAVAMRPAARLEFYQSSIVGQWIIVLLVAVAVLGSGSVLSTLGVAWPIWTAETFAVTLIVVLLTLTQTPIVPAVRTRLANSPSLLRALYPLRNLLPRSKKERERWVSLSATAGICEEIIFRGFLFFYVQDVLGLSLYSAVIISSAIFGISHAYQGTGNVLRTGAIGLLFGTTYAMTDSLLVPIVLHVVLDLGGLYMAEIVDAEEIKMRSELDEPNDVS